MSKEKFFITTIDNEKKIFDDIVSARDYAEHILKKYGFGFTPRIYPM